MPTACLPLPLEYLFKIGFTSMETKLKASLRASNKSAELFLVANAGKLRSRYFETYRWLRYWLVLIEHHFDQRFPYPMQFIECFCLSFPVSFAPF